MTARTGRAEYRPALRAEVLVSGELLHGARRVHLIKDLDSGRSYEVGVKEHFLITRMDGSRRLEEIAAEYAVHYGRRLGDEHWQRLLRMLGSRGLLAGAAAPDAVGTGESPGTRETSGTRESPGTPETSGTPEAPDGPAPRANTVLRGSLPLVSDADATVRRLHRVAGFLLSARWMVPLLLLVVAMETLAVLHVPELAEGTREMFGHPALLACVAVLLWLSTALHELAHGVVARHYGGRVTDIGLKWRLPVAIMYCSVDNYLYLPRRRHRLATAVAGAVMNLLFLLPFAAVRLFAPLDDATLDALSGLLFLGSLQALAMLVPLPPLDGYTLVGQALGVTELAASSRHYLRLAVRRDPSALAYPRRARAVYTAYGLGSVLVVGALAAAGGLIVHLLLI